MPPRVHFCLSLYRRLANAFPHEFRMVYGEDLERLGEDAVPQVWHRYGVPGLVRLLADIALRLPGEYLAELRQDTVYAARMLAKAPGFTLVAVLSLATGIGMCCAFFSEMQYVVRPPAGIRDSQALLAVRSGVSYPYFERYRDRRRPSSAMTAFLGPVPFAVAFAADPSAKAERFYGHLVSPEFFSTLGVTPAAGRLFAAETEKPGMPPVVVVSHRFWLSQLRGDPRAVGRTLRVNGATATIVGIGPPEFLGIWPANPADLYVPVTCGARLAPEMNPDPLPLYDREIFRVILRLPSRVTIPMAEAGLNASMRNLDREFGVHRETKGTVMRLMPAGTAMIISPEQRAFANTFTFVLWALVLSLVCANLANLLLARGSRRRPEIAVRLSMGASRARLVRQFLTESVLLSLAGALGGILLAFWITRVISSSWAPSWNAQVVDCRPDWQVMAWTLAIAVAAGVGFGLVPALASARLDIGLTLKEGAQAPLRGYRRFGLRNLFVVCQVAASLMLVLVTWRMASSFQRFSRIDPGFEAANLDLVSLDPVRDGYSAGDAAELLAALPGELARLDGVRAVSWTGGTPFANLTAEQPNTRVTTSDEGGIGQVVLAVFRERVGPDYFATLGVPLVGGREFTRQDAVQAEHTASPLAHARSSEQSRGREGAVSLYIPAIPNVSAKGAAPTPAVINQAAARVLFGNENPIGRHIREGEDTYVVVGLARDVRSGLLTAKPVATVFLPLTAGQFRANPTQSATLLVRGTAGRNTLAAVRRQLASLHPELTAFNARTLKEDLDRLNSFVVWQSTIFEVLGCFALLLACVGLGGVTAYAVARRRKEIGIRMALGARGLEVQGLVLKEGTALVAAGSALGFTGAFALSRVFAAYSDVLARSFGRQNTDPLLIAGAPLLLAGMAMLACYLPARRATRIDPMSALREE